MRKNQLFLVAVGVLLFGAAQVQATPLVSTSGIFAGVNDVVTQTFFYDPSTMYATVNIQTWGYGGSSGAPGGTNLAGDVIPAGGFDSMVWLFLGTGSTASLLDSNDDGACPPGTTNPNCFDATLNVSGLASGTYTVALSQFDNVPTGGVLGTTSGPGSTWTNAGVANFNGRTSRYALDVQDVPEPATFLLLGVGLLSIGLLKKRHASS